MKSPQLQLKIRVDTNGKVFCNFVIYQTDLFEIDTRHFKTACHLTLVAVPSPPFVRLIKISFFFLTEQRLTLKADSAATCHLFRDFLQFFRVVCFIYRVIQNDCRGFNNLSYTIHLR
jgi:hypothetical protein